MIRKVNVCSVGQIQSGTSQSTGNQWRKQEFVVEWYESPSDTQSQKIVLSVMNDNIDKLKVQIGDKMEVRFDLRYREYNGRYYMDVYAPFDAMKKIGGLQPAANAAGVAAGAQPQQQSLQMDGGTGAAPAAAAPPSGQAPAGQPAPGMEQEVIYDENGNPINGDDLPF